MADWPTAFVQAYTAILIGFCVYASFWSKGDAHSKNATLIFTISQVPIWLKVFDVI